MPSSMIVEPPSGTGDTPIRFNLSEIPWCNSPSKDAKVSLVKRYFPGAKVFRPLLPPRDSARLPPSEAQQSHHRGSQQG